MGKCTACPAAGDCLSGLRHAVSAPCIPVGQEPPGRNQLPARKRLSDSWGLLCPQPHVAAQAPAQKGPMDKPQSQWHLQPANSGVLCAGAPSPAPAPARASAARQLNQRCDPVPAPRARQQGAQGGRHPAGPPGLRQVPRSAHHQGPGGAARRGACQDPLHRRLLCHCARSCSACMLTCCLPAEQQQGFLCRGLHFLSMSSSSQLSNPRLVPTLYQQPH